MNAYALAVLGAGFVACSASSTQVATPAPCSTRLQEIYADGWSSEPAPPEQTSEFEFTRLSEGIVYYRALRCDAGQVLVDAEWASFNTHDEAQAEYDRRLANLAASCSTGIIEPPGLPQEPRSPKPLSSTTYFASAASYIAIAGCLGPEEKRILSFARSDSHGVASPAETTWAVEYNRQPHP